jgi:di/tricarboxylate transporter
MPPPAPPLALLALPLALALPVALLLGRLPLELAALGLALAAVLAGWLSPAEALSGFGNPATLAVVAMFVISAAVVRTGALAPIERWLAGFAHISLPAQLLLLAAVVGPLSAVLSNTAVVAMFIPLVERWCRRLGLAPAQMLMPLSFLTVLAGVGTLLGTSTNLVASSLSAQLGYGGFHLLQFTPMALVTYGAGVLVLLLVAPRVLKGPPPLPAAAEIVSDYGIRDYLSELRVSEASPLAGKSLDASLLQHSFDLRVLALIRDSARLTPPLGDQRLCPGDVLVVKARRDGLLALQDQEGLDLLPDGCLRWNVGGTAPAGATADAAKAEGATAEGATPAGTKDGGATAAGATAGGAATGAASTARGTPVGGTLGGSGLAGSTPVGGTLVGQPVAPTVSAVVPGGSALHLSVVEAVVPDGSPLIGRSLRELRFAQRTNTAVLAIRRGEEVLRDRLGKVALRLGDALLLQAPEASLRALRVSGDLLLAELAEAPADRRDRLPWALGLMAAMLLLTLWRSDALAIWALLAVLGMVAARVLTPQEVYAAVRWDVVALLAALLPLAQLMGGSGVDRLLVGAMASLANGWPPYAVLIGFYLATTLATELLSNQAAVTLMLPLALGLGRELGLPAQAVLGVVTFAASHSFLTPIGYQTNTMVYALGNYTFLDFLRLGLPLTLVLALLTPALALAL